MFSNAGDSESCQRGFIGGIAQRLSSYMIITFIWILGLLITLPPLFGWSYYAPEDSGMR
jgi:hypothetical protein